jgi:hypothetical protein
VCFDGWWMDTDHYCKPCPAACTKCTNASTCTACKEFSTGDFATGCPCSLGTDSACSGECTPISFYDNCHWSQYWEISTTAATNTSAATTATGICKNCHSTCGSCSGGLDTECQSCRYPFILEGGAVPAKCLCSDGYYEIFHTDTATNEQHRGCHECHFSCSTCTGAGDNTCTACNTQFTLNGTKCECPANQYWSQLVERCVEQTAHEDGKYDCDTNNDPSTLEKCPCHASCFNCTGPQAD